MQDPLVQTLSDTASSKAVDKTASITQQQKACLNAMGVTIYTPLQGIILKNEPWIRDVCELLKIEVQDCIYDSEKPHFDDKSQVLHLPEQSYASVAEIKKSIWQSIRPFLG